jgi:glutathione synthase/RimK-type ligase-like ATP-grasp enzyme
VIAFCGVPSEEPLRLAIEAAERRRVRFLLLNQRQARFLAVRISLQDGGIGGTLGVGDTTYALAEIRGVYARMVDSSMLPENRASRGRAPNPVDVERSRVLHEALFQWLELAPCRVLNRPGSMGSNISKPYQCQLIRRCGFSIPTTLVTNDAAEVLAFHARHGRVIFKSISATRSIVRELDPKDLRGLRRLRHLPTQFQAFVSGVNLRVHVVGERVFATEVESEATDYRYASRGGHEVRMRPVELPAEVARRCVRLAAELGLPLSGIDLKRTSEDEFYCLEVNPSPAYSFYQEQTGQPIADAIVDYLVESRRGPSSRTR